MDQSNLKKLKYYAVHWKSWDNVHDHHVLLANSKAHAWRLTVAMHNIYDHPIKLEIKKLEVKP